MGITRSEYMRDFDRMNLLPYFPGRHMCADKFPMTPAKLAARVIRPLLSGRTVILVGRSVADAFGFKADWHDWVEWPVRRYCPVQRDAGRCLIAVVPHPSGRNHWYNKEENRKEALTFWADLRKDEVDTNKVLSFAGR